MIATIGYYICVPFAWVTRLFYSLTGSYGVALILFTLVVKLVLLPFQLKSKKSMLRMSRLNPKMKEIQAKYANNKEKQNQEISKLYMESGVNPMSGCLWSFIPFPILIALYYIIRQPLRYFMMLSNETVTAVINMATGMGLTVGANDAYAQITVTQFVSEHFDTFAAKFDGLINLDYNFLGINLAEIPNKFFSTFPGGGWAVWGLMLLPIISAALNVLMSKITMKSQNGGAEAQKTNRMMMIFMPLMTLWMGFILPSALCVYWICNSCFSILQELLLNKHYNKILDAEETDKERAKREARIKKMEAAQATYEQRLADAKGANKNTSKKKLQSQQNQRDAARKEKTNENGRVGQRPYARGRAYHEDHYDDE
jgi:YidC/Oxa1 family membrane protein insertase